MKDGQAGISGLQTELLYARLFLPCTGGVLISGNIGPPFEMEASTSVATRRQ